MGKNWTDQKSTAYAGSNPQEYFLNQETQEEIEMNQENVPESSVTHRESLVDSLTSTNNDTLVDSTETLEYTSMPSFNLQPPQALHFRPSPAVAATAGVNEELNSNNVNITLGMTTGRHNGSEISINMKTYMSSTDLETTKTQPRQRRNTTFHSNGSNINLSVASTEKTSIFSSTNNSNQNLHSDSNLKYVEPNDSNYPISKTGIGGVRKQSIYKPVHHAPLSHSSTSFFHIFRFASPFDYLLIMLASFFSISSGLVIPLMTQFLGHLFNVFTEQQSGVITKTVFQTKINELAMNFVSLSVGTFFLSALMNFIWMWTAERQTKKMREIYFQSLLRMGIGYFEMDDVTSGGLLTSLNKDAEDVQNALSENLGLTIQYLTTVIGCLLLAFYKNYQLTLVIMGSIPFLLGSLIFTSKAATPLIKKERSIFLKAGNILEYSLSAIRTIKIFNGEEKEEQRHLECLREADSVSGSLAWTFALRTGLMQFILLSLFVQGFWFGAILVANKKLSPGDVLSVFYSCLLAATAIKSILPLLAYFSRAKNAVRAINKLLEKVAILDLEALRGFRLGKCEGNIELQQVSFAYPSRPDTLVLKNVDILIPAGKTTVLVGQSGSGKSTVAQLIQRLYETKEGLVTLDGREIGILNTEWLRQQLGVVSQEPILFDDTIFQNIAYGRADYWNVTYEEVVAACEVACVHDFILTLPERYQTHLGDKAKQLSGGQKQRIAIARALIKDPTILILDEASSALDMASDQKVQNALDNCRQGRTTLVITHQLSHVKDTDLVYVIEKGEVVEYGTKKELMANELSHFYMLAKKPEISQTKQRTKQLQAVDRRLKRSSSLPYKQIIDYQSIDLSTSAGLLQRSLSMATRTGWRQSVYEDYVDKSVMDVLSQSATASLTKRNENRISYFGILSYYDEIDETPGNPIDIKISSPHETSFISQYKIRMSFLQLLKETMENKLVYTFGLLAAIVNGCVMPTFSYVLSELLTTYALPDKNKLESQARNWALIVLLIAVGNGISAHLKYYLLEISSEKWAIKLRHLCFGRILCQSQAFFDKSESATGKLTTMLINDTDSAKNLVGHFAGSIVFVVFSLFVGIGWAFAIGWKLTLVGLAMVPVILLAAKFQGFILQRHEKKRKLAGEDAANAFYQTMSSVRTVYSLSIESAMQKKFNLALQKPYNIGMRKALICGLCSGMLEALGYFTKAITFYYGGHLVSEGTYDLKRMLTVWTLIIFCTTSASTILTTIPYFARSKQAGKALCQIMSLPTPPKGGIKPEKVQGNLTFKNIYFTYPERPENLILKGFTLNVMPGKTVALVGTSGSGKSTIAALLQRLYMPTSGHLLLDYHSIHEMDLHWFREQIGIVSQEPVLFDMSISENIKYGKESATQTEIEEAARLVNVHEFIISLPDGYNTKLGSGGSQLSGGQKQRIAIARVLIRNPKILILDEATSALDTTNEGIVQEALDKAGNGRTTLVITHRLNSVKKADKIAFLEGGKIIELGTHEELMKMRGSYWKLASNESDA
ncbi:hypothetical protein G9A89_005652 [Geosiphon pyriformis]|nr:hypothetical protein G9A89_005652 [Geosiphon pyriformis]